MFTNPRDLTQRSIGCIGFSAIAHGSLLVLLLLAPRSSEIESGAKTAGGAKDESPVEVVMSQGVETSTSASNKVVAAEAPAPIEAPKREHLTEMVVPKNEAKVVSVPTPKALPEKKSARAAKAVAVKAIKTVEKSDVAAETSTKQPELEELSPVIADEPAAEGESNPTANAKENPTDEAPVAPSAAETSIEKPEAAQSKLEPVESSEPAVKVAANTEAKPALEAQTASNVAADQGTNSGKGQGAGTGTGDGTGSQQNEGIQTKAVEASARNPLPGNPLPQYPRLDRMHNREGTTIVLGEVRRDGMIENVRLDKSSGSREMDLAALNAFKKWRFAPGPEAVVRKAFQFRLQGAAQVGYATLKK